MAVIRDIYLAGRGVPGVRPEVTATLAGMAALEDKIGTAAALEAMVSATLTVSATLGMGDPRMFDAAVAMLEDSAKRLREAQADIAAGRAPSGAVIGMIGGAAHREGRA